MRVSLEGGNFKAAHVIGARAANHLARLLVCPTAE
jgi:hypothetical protein